MWAFVTLRFTHRSLWTILLLVVLAVLLLVGLLHTHVKLLLP